MELSKTCNKKDCDKLSVFVPEIIIYHKGWKHRKCPPIKTLIGLSLCLYCSKKFKVKNILNNDFKKLMETLHLRNGVTRPNFKKTKMNMIRINELSQEVKT